MKILLIQPPDIHAEKFDVATAKRHRYLNYPPYGLGLLAAIAEKDGHEVEIVNLQTAVLHDAQSDFHDFDYDISWKHELLRYQVYHENTPDLIGLTCMFSQTHKSLQAVSECLHELFPDVKQIAGGVHITNSLIQAETQDKFLADLPYISEFMMFECDAAFREYLKGNRYQCAVRTPSGIEWHHEKVAPDTLNALPAWHLMDPRVSSKTGKVGAFYFLRGDPVTATVLSNRGCRAHCTFCSVRNFNGEGVRRRGVDSVVDELLLLQNDYGVEHIMWLDDDFLFDRRETVALFNQMVKRDVRLTWDCSNGVIAKSCTEEVLSAAVESGCIGLILGMESGNPQILKEIKKPGTVRVFLEAAKVMRKFEQIHTRVFLMIGFPGETLRMIKDTLDVAREMDLDWYNIAPLQALPNTPIYKAANPTEFTEIKFNSGPHSRVAQKAGGSPWLLDFKHAFDDLDRIPTVAELDSIWAYMNYHLNYDRLQREVRPVKLAMQQKYVEHICDLIAPDNAFAMHYSKLLSTKLGQPITQLQNDRLEKLLEHSPYWINRFNDFGITV